MLGKNTCTLSSPDINSMNFSTQKYAKTFIKLPKWRNKKHSCQVMGSVKSVWVLFLPSAHTRHKKPTYFAGNPCTARITVTITLI